MLEITPNQDRGFLSLFAEFIGGKVESGRVNIPEKSGKGYIQGYLFGPAMRMMIRDYEFNEDLMLRIVPDNTIEKIVMSFNNAFNAKGQVRNAAAEATFMPSVQIGVGNIDYEMIFPGKTRFKSIIIVVDAKYLKSLLNPEEDNAILKTITTSKQPLLFEEFVSPQIQKVASEIVNMVVPASLKDFYFRLKAEELMCLLFMDLLKRGNTPVHALKVSDIEKVYQIKDKILSNLNIPPNLNTLAISACMSESKLKRLFKQIFGNSIFNYYQFYRMQEAAQLIKEQKLSISEVGYRLGFTNLSHFGRVFEEHIGTKPKKYSLQ